MFYVQPSRFKMPRRCHCSVELFAGAIFKYQAAGQRFHYQIAGFAVMSQKMMRSAVKAGKPSANQIR
jgi:hypothetical protein